MHVDGIYTSAPSHIARILPRNCHVSDSLSQAISFSQEVRVYQVIPLPALVSGVVATVVEIIRSYRVTERILDEERNQTC